MTSTDLIFFPFGTEGSLLKEISSFSMNKVIFQSTQKIFIQRRKISKNTQKLNKLFHPLPDYNITKPLTDVEMLIRIIVLDGARVFTTRLSLENIEDQAIEGKISSKRSNL